MRLAAAAAFGMSAFALAACGGGSSSDKDQIADILRAIGKNPLAFCDHVV
jgi:hypothetical protein